MRKRVFLTRVLAAVVGAAALAFVWLFNANPFGICTLAGCESYMSIDTGVPWFAGITCSILSSLYSLYRLRERSQKLSSSHSLKAGEAEPVVEAKKIVHEANAVRLQLLSDVCDITIPAASITLQGH